MLDKSLSEVDARYIAMSLEVLDLLSRNPRMSQKKACNEIGIDPKTYRKWISTQTEALQTLQEIKEESEKNHYADYLIAQDAITDKLLSDGVSNDTKPKERLAILQYVNSQVEKLADKYHVVDTTTNDMLNGPVQEPGENRMAHHDVLVSENNNNDTIIIVKDKKTIDGKFNEDKENQFPALEST